MNSSQQPICVARELNHIVIAVKNIEETLEFYRLLFGLESGQIKEIVDQGVRAALIKVGKPSLRLSSQSKPLGVYLGSSIKREKGFTISALRWKICGQLLSGLMTRG